MKNKIPYKLISEENGESVTVYMYGVIGQRPSLYDVDNNKSEDITDMEFLKLVRKYEEAGKTRLDIRLNSPGGSTVHLDGIVAQMQTTKMEVHTWIDGIAASAAADIWLAAKKENRHMAKNAKLMIHGPVDSCYGNVKAMEACAEKLRKFEDAYVSQMASDTGQTEDEIRSKYYDGNDHWMTAKDCEQEGLIVKVEDYEAEKMPKDPEKLAPDALFDFFEEKKEEQAVSIFKKLHDLAFPKKEAYFQPKIDEEMNIDNIKKALESGEINEADLLQALNAQKMTTPPAAEKSVEDLVTAAVEKVVKPLQQKIEEQAAEIKKLGDEPGARRTGVASEGDETDLGNDAADFAELENLNKSLTSAAKNGEALKVSGYGTGIPRK